MDIISIKNNCPIIDKVLSREMSDTGKEMEIWALS